MNIWMIMVLALFVFVLIGGYKLALALGYWSERIVAFLDRLGLRRLAGALLHFAFSRFALFWGFALGLALLLFIFWQGRVISSVPQWWVSIMGIYSSWRMYTWFQLSDDEEEPVQDCPLSDEQNYPSDSKSINWNYSSEHLD